MKKRNFAAGKGSKFSNSNLPDDLIDRGNAFMRMFDDHGEGAEHNSDEKPLETRHLMKKKKLRNVAMRENVASEEAISSIATANDTNAELDEIFSEAIKRAGPETSQNTVEVALQGGRKAEVVTFVDPERRRGGIGSAAAVLREQEARERRSFMSCKVAKVHQEVTFKPSDYASMGQELDQDGLVSQAAFKEMQREAEELGATALDKKSRKAYDAQKLSAIGAKIEKGPRISAIIGKGMAKKQEERSAKALEEAINAGLVQRKGLGKKKRRIQQAAAGKPKSGVHDGLGGRFKDGILHVKPIGTSKNGVNRKKSLLKGIKL